MQRLKCVHIYSPGPHGFLFPDPPAYYEVSKSVICDGYCDWLNSISSLSMPVAALPALDWPLPSSSEQYELRIDVQPRQHHRAHYETEGSRGAVKASAGGHPVVQVKWGQSCVFRFEEAKPWEGGKVGFVCFYKDAWGVNTKILENRCVWKCAETVVWAI